MYSSIVKITFNTLPESIGIPQNLIASFGDFRDKIVTNWSPVTGAEKYGIFRRSGSGGVLIKIAETTETTFEDTNISSNFIYTYFVSAYSVANGWGNTSEGVNGMAVAVGTPATIAPVMPVYDLFFGDPDIDIVFYLPRFFTTDDVITVRAFIQSQEVVTSASTVVKVFDNIVTWNTSNILQKPISASLILRCEIAGSETRAYAVLQCKNKSTSVETSSSKNGKLVW